MLELILSIMVSDTDSIETRKEDVIEWCLNHKEIPFLYYNIDALFLTGISLSNEYTLFEIMDNISELSTEFPEITFILDENYPTYIASTYIKNYFKAGKSCKVEGEVVFPEVTDDMFKTRNPEHLHVSPRGEMYVL